MFESRKKVSSSSRESSNGEELDSSFNDTRDSNLSQKNKNKEKKSKGLFGGFFSRSKKDRSSRNEDDADSS